MPAKRISFTTFNLLNLNLPGRPIYGDADGWSEDQYARKIDWIARMLRTARADVFGFQELWAEAALRAAFETAGLAGDYDLLAPPGHGGGSIVSAAAVRRGIVDGAPGWITRFPDGFRLQSSGDDPQAPDISVAIDRFSRPVLHFAVRPLASERPIQVFVAHLKSKAPTKLDHEAWFRADKPRYAPHREALGAAISTIRRTAEAAALRWIITAATRGNNDPVVVLGDLNDGQLSNTLAIVTGQPTYLVGLSTGGGDTDLYAAQTLQEYRASRDVYFTYIHQDMHQSLDHILVSRELYDNSRSRIWAFEGLDIWNDHLNADAAETMTGDHGVVRASFRHAPAKVSPGS